MAAAVVHADPLGSAGLGELSPARKIELLLLSLCKHRKSNWTCILFVGDYDEIVSEIKRVLETEEEIRSVSEVQVYYKDNGRITAKADIVLRPDLTIGQAHAIAGKMEEKKIQ